MEKCVLFVCTGNTCRSPMAEAWFNKCAAEAGLTANYFLRHFQTVTGVSPGRYLRRLRYDNAARMLSEGSLSIEQICQEIGVKDRFHFSREFKRYFGEPPAQYRKHYRAVFAGKCRKDEKN